MKAHLGDQLVVESPATGAMRRDGEIIGLHHADGPDAHIRHLQHPAGPPAPGAARTQTATRRAGHSWAWTTHSARP